MRCFTLTLIFFVVGSILVTFTFMDWPTESSSDGLLILLHEMSVICKRAIKSVRSGLGKSEDVLDVGSGRAISCNDLAKKIVRMTDSKSKIVHIPMRIGEALNTKIVAKSHTKLFKKLNYKLQFTLDDTIENCIDYTKSLGHDYLLKAYNFYKK